MNTPKNPGKKNGTAKPAEDRFNEDDELDDDKTEEPFAEGDDDDYDLPLDEIGGFDEFSTGSYDDDDDY